MLLKTCCSWNPLYFLQPTETLEIMRHFCFLAKKMSVTWWTKQLRIATWKSFLIKYNQSNSYFKGFIWWSEIETSFEIFRKPSNWTCWKLTKWATASALVIEIVCHFAWLRFALQIIPAVPLHSEQLRTFLFQTVCAIKKYGGCPVTLVCHNCALNQQVYTLLGGPGKVLFQCLKGAFHTQVVT